MIGSVFTPSRAMRLAIEEGRKGIGRVSPNPPVGCTILDHEYRLLAVGHHERVGEAHAEINALKKVTNTDLLKGAHVFVTLEPCAHQGRTGSCAKALAPLGIGSLTYAVEDPNPLVAGKGAEILKQAGIETWLLKDRVDIEEAIELTALAEELAEIFLYYMRKKRVFVGIKVGTTLDGIMATDTGESKWITGPAAREHAHRVRLSYDAVAIGRHTFEADDPSLNVRLDTHPNHQNRVVVFDPSGKSLARLEKSKLLKVRPPEMVWIVTGREAKLRKPSGVHVLEASVNENGLFDIDAVLTRLKLEGLTSIMVEGGSQTYANFFNAGRVQRLHAYVAPSLLGGRHGVSWSAGFGVDQMARQIRLTHTKRDVLGDDLYWTSRVEFA